LISLFESVHEARNSVHSSTVSSLARLWKAASLQISSTDKAALASSTLEAREHGLCESSTVRSVENVGVVEWDRCLGIVVLYV
jgi:hypothetical protein